MKQLDLFPTCPDCGVPLSEHTFAPCTLEAFLFRNPDEEDNMVDEED